MALYGAIPFVTCVQRSGAASGLLALNPSEGFVQVAFHGDGIDIAYRSYSV
jgi:hypothetical protein